MGPFKNISWEAWVEGATLGGMLIKEPEEAHPLTISAVSQTPGDR